MLVLKRASENYSAFFESKQDEERLRSYLGDDLFNQYMDVRKKLPSLSNQFKDFSKIELNTDNNKKELLSSYNRLVDVLPKDLKSKYKKLDVDITKLSSDKAKDILDTYMEARNLYFKDQESFKSFSQLMKQDIKDIQDFVDNYQSKSAQKRLDKIEGADKLYEDSEWVVYRITTYPAAKLYGSGTKWCITGRFPGHEGRGEEYFNNYIEDFSLDGGYYFYINKNKPEDKYCLLRGKNGDVVSLWKADDTEIGASYTDLLDDGISLPDIPSITLPKYSSHTLFKAVRDNDVQKTRDILQYVTVDDVNEMNEDREHVLDIAVNNGNRDMVQVLLENSADANIVDDEGKSVLRRAVEKGDDVIVGLLLDNLARIDYDEEKHGPLLDISVQNEDKSIVDLLLKAGADINTGLFSSLHEAAAKGNLDIMKSLLKYAEDVDLEDETGKTPLHLASSLGYTDIARALLDENAYPMSTDSYGKTPLYYASKYGHDDIVEVLKSYGAEE